MLIPAGSNVPSYVISSVTFCSGSRAGVSSSGISAGVRAFQLHPPSVSRDRQESDNKEMRLIGRGERGTEVYKIAADKQAGRGSLLVCYVCSLSTSKRANKITSKLTATCCQWR